MHEENILDLKDINYKGTFANLEELIKAKVEGKGNYVEIAGGAYLGPSIYIFDSDDNTWVLFYVLKKQES